MRQFSLDLWKGRKPRTARNAAHIAVVGSSLGVGGSAGRAARVGGRAYVSQCQGIGGNILIFQAQALSGLPFGALQIIERGE